MQSPMQCSDLDGMSIWEEEVGQAHSGMTDQLVNFYPLKLVNTDAYAQLIAVSKEACTRRSQSRLYWTVFPCCL